MRTLALCALGVAGCVASGLQAPSYDHDLGSASGSLCTSAACAADPCTPGCAFAAPLGGGCAGQVAVATPRVVACSNFCGLNGDSLASDLVGCGDYDGSADGCNACGARWGSPTCVNISPVADYRRGGAICHPGQACYPLRWFEDEGIPCYDLSQPRDMTLPD
jgi:hypothetical protein